MRKYLFAVIGLLCVAGCVATTTGRQFVPQSRQPAVAGREFERPTLGDVKLGHMTSEQVKARFGEPYGQKIFTVSKSVTSGGKSAFENAPLDGVLTLYNYFLGQGVDSPAGGNVAAKFANFVFLNDTLYSYNFVSNFAQASTQFDENKLNQLKKRKTTKADAVALFGEPGGHAIYPLVMIPGTEKLTYFAFNIDIARKQVDQKSLDMLFDESGLLIDFRFAGGGSDLGAAKSPAPANQAPADKAPAYTGSGEG